MDIKRLIGKEGIGRITCAMIVILLVFRFGSVYLNQEKKMHSELYVLFVEAMQDEKEQQIKRHKRNYNSQKSSNDISGEEKYSWCTQDYLTMRDPNRHYLDSLYRDILQKKNIEVKTAIRCIRNGVVITTSTDSLFYKGATPLEPIVYRIDENKENNITLQAYVDIPVWTALERIGWLWMVFFLFFILLVGCCGFYFDKLKNNIERITKLLKSIKKSWQDSRKLVRRQQVELARLQVQIQETESARKLQVRLLEQKQVELTQIQAKKQEAESINKQQAELLRKKQSELAEMQTKMENTNLISKQQAESLRKKQAELTEIQAKKQETESVNKQQAELLRKKQTELTEMQTQIENMNLIREQQAESLRKKQTELTEIQARKQEAESVNKQQTELLRKKQTELTEMQTQIENMNLIREQQAELLEMRQAELFALKNEVIPLVPKQKTVWSALPCGFLFDEKHGILRDENGLPVSLKTNSLRLFHAFVNAENYRLSYKEICTDVLIRSIKGGVDQSCRESVSMAIHRLKECLRPFSCIEIISIRGSGYQMVFSNYQNDTTLPGKSD